MYVDARIMKRKDIFGKVKKRELKDGKRDEEKKKYLCTTV